MEVQKFEKLDELVSATVALVGRIVAEKPDAVLCFACGETPRPVMQQLAKLKALGKTDFSRVRMLGLDEWVGVGRGTAGSCAQMLYDDFFTPMGFREDQISIFDGLSGDLDSEIQKANRLVNDLGIDFVLLGVGMNGHIGLNEPGFNPNTQAQIVELSETTRTVMKKYFRGGTDLTQGITLGFSQLLAARNILLLATGARKAEIVRDVVNSSATNNLPASLLKETGQDSYFFVDSEAGRYV